VLPRLRRHVARGDAAGVQAVALEEPGVVGPGAVGQLLLLRQRDRHALTQRVLRLDGSHRPGGWRTVKPSGERGAVCQRDGLAPDVSKRRPATTMYMWVLWA